MRRRSPKVSVCQLPTNLSPGHPAWRELVRHIESERPDIALLNEMPLGPWIASEATFEEDLAAASIAAHESALQALRALPAAVISSRPIRGAHKLINEAFLLADGVYQAIHHKHYFPEEAGFFEETWFAPNDLASTWSSIAVFGSVCCCVRSSCSRNGRGTTAARELTSSRRHARAGLT